MANDNGGDYDPQRGRPDPGAAGGQHEIVPWEYSGVATPDPQPMSPSPVVGQAPIPVRPRTLKVMMAMIVVLLLVVGGLAFAVLGSSKTPAAAAGPIVTSSSPAAVGTTDAAVSPSAEVSASPSDTLATDTPTSASTDTSTDSPTDSALPSSSFSPLFGSQALGSPVDGSVDPGRDEHISNVDYPNSVGFSCPTHGMLDWDVAGFTTFTAVFGIPDDAEYATGIVNTVTFSDQNGHQLDVAKTAIGQPVQIQFALKGAARLVMTCARQGSNVADYNYVTLGDPVISVS